MSETYRNNEDETPRSGSGKSYATPRYRPGSRRKPRRIVARGIRRDDVDLDRFARVLVEALILQASREIEAERKVDAEAQQEDEKERPDEGGHDA